MGGWIAWAGDVVAAGCESIELVTDQGLCKTLHRDPPGTGPTVAWMEGGRLRTAGRRVYWNDIYVGDRTGLNSFRLKGKSGAGK